MAQRPDCGCDIRRPGCSSGTTRVSSRSRKAGEGSALRNSTQFRNVVSRGADSSLRFGMTLSSLNKLLSPPRWLHPTCYNFQVVAGFGGPAIPQTYDCTGLLEG